MIRPSHLSPQSQDESDGKGLFDECLKLLALRASADRAERWAQYYKSKDKPVAPHHDGVGVVLADTGKAIYEAAVRAQRAIVPELPIRNKGGC